LLEIRLFTGRRRRREGRRRQVELARGSGKSGRGKLILIKSPALVSASLHWRGSRMRGQRS